MANVKATDLITFTRASAGHALRKVSYGSELVTNGTFTDNIDGWQASSANATLSHSTDTLQVVATGGGVGAVLTSAITVEVGKIYTVDVESTSATGRHQIRVGNSSATSSEYFASNIVDGVATKFRTTFVATKTTLYIYLRSDNAGTTKWDNVSVKEVTFDQADGTLQLFEHPEDIPRIEYDDSGNLLGLLIEESRANRVQYSTPDSNWNTSTLGTGVTPVVTLNNEASPDGTTSAAKVVLDVGGGTTSGDRSLFLVPSASVTATNSYAGSVWLKGETGGERVVMRHAGNATYSLFTLTSSWARYDVTETAAGSSATMAIGLKGNQSDATATIYVWGAQIEQGSFPTSTIVNNTGTQKTRSAEVASIDVDQFGFNANEGSVFCEVQHFTPESSSAHSAFGFDDGTSNNRMWYYQNKGQWIVSNSGTTTVSIDATDPSENTSTKVGVTYKNNDYVLYIDGDNKGSDTSSAVPTVTQLGIGKVSANGTGLHGHIKSINYYPKRLSNSKLQELTS